MSWFSHWLLPHESNNQRAKLLHPSSLGLIIGVFAVFQIGLGQLTRHYPQILGYASQIAPDEIIRLTNVERQNKGLPAVAYNAQLSAAAAQKAADMYARDYWAHVSPVGTQPWFFITESGYNYRYAGENLARDFSDPASVIAAWINSPSHRDNLLSDKYQDIGVAVVDGKLGGQETTLVVQMFGTQLAAVSAPVAKSPLDISVQAAETATIPTATPRLVISPTPYVVAIATLDAPTPTATSVPAQETVVGQTLAATPPISPFGVTKAISVAILVLIIGVLTVDVIMVYRHKIVRWTSRSVAHLAFMVFLLISAIIIYRGQIM